MPFSKCLIANRISVIARLISLTLICFFTGFSAVATTEIKKTNQIPTEENQKVLLKGQVEFKIHKDQKIPIRITQIPTQYPWVERDLDGRVLPPEINSEIIGESTQDVYVEDPFTNKEYLLSAGTKFYAKVKSLKDARSFRRDGYMVLEFYKLEINSSTLVSSGGDDPISVQSNEINLERAFTSSAMKNIASVGAYTLGGALAGPVVAYRILGLPNRFLGLISLSNPYVSGGSAAIGGALGLAYGVSKSGQFYNVEPGTELNLKLQNSWILSLADALPALSNDDKSHMSDGDGSRPVPTGVALSIVKVKKAKDVFGDQCLAVTFEYSNNTNEELRYSSFKLVDSMGKEYEPSPGSFNDDIFGLVPKQQSRLTLHFATDFLKAIHELRAVKLFNQKVLGSVRVVY